MTPLGIRTLLDMMQVSLLAGLTLTLSVSKASGQECEYLIASAVGPITNYVSHDDYLYSLVPYIQDPNGEGTVQNFCETYPRVRTKLRNLLRECRGSGDIKVYLAKMAGYDYLCNAGQVDYGRHSKCIFEMAPKLKTECSTEHDTLNSIRKVSVFATPDTVASICTEIQKYIQCSHDQISKGCEGTDAGNWYRSFLKSVLKHMKDSKQLKCSFGKTVLPMWAVGLIVGVGLLILWCIARWLYVDGYCRRACVCICGERCASKSDSEKNRDADKIESLTYRRGSIVDHLPSDLQMTALNLEDDDSLTGGKDFTRLPMKNGILH